MILQHQFDEEKHLYKVEGQFVLSTSDIISLNGLANYGSCPAAILAYASWRGTQLHRAIQFFEEDSLVPDMPDEVVPYFGGYCKFRTKYDFEPIGDLEKQIVYLHEGTEQAVGCTIDMRGLINGKPYLLDVKTSAKQYGKALKQKVLAWRMQTASYLCANESDEDWWALTETGEACHRGIIQVNKEGGFEFHDFGKLDDALLWDSCVRVAMAKMANGFQLERF
ncbi:MAG: hypothetical protein ACRELE_06005 [Gemmatimonadales bacterium]